MKRVSFLRALNVLLALALTSGAAVCEEAFRYQSKGRRDPFVPLIGPDKVTRARLEDISSVNELVLEGVAIGSGGKRIAIIHGEMLKEKDRVGNLTIIKVSDRSVALSISGKEYNLKLDGEGGDKGEM